MSEGTTRQVARSDPQNSLNFELPPEWLSEGQLHLQLDHLEIDGNFSFHRCIDCDNPRLPGPPGGDVVRFHAVPPMRVWLVGVPLELPMRTDPVVPRQLDFDMLASWIRRTYPASDVRITQTSLPEITQAALPPGPPGATRLPTCHYVNAAITFWALQIPGESIHTRYYGLVGDNGGGTFMGGCSLLDGGTIGSGPAGPSWPFETDHWDKDGSYADWYGGHELGHLYGRLHPGFCAGNTDDDDDFPYANGLLGSSLFDNQGWDAGDAALGLPVATYDWRNAASDIMTYCPDEWMSAYTYRGILRYGCEETSQGCPTIPVRHGPELPAETSSAGSERREARKGSHGRQWLTVSGSLSPESGKVDLDPLSTLRGVAPTDRPRRSPYSIVLRSSAGRELARYPFTPKLESDLARGRRLALIQEVVRFDERTRVVEIRKGKRTLERVRASAHAPQVRIISPERSKRLGRRVTVRWRGNDPDDDRLTYSLLYSPRGDRWVPVAAGLRKRSYRVDLGDLPGGRKARFRVVATDGVRADVAVAGGFKVPVKSPAVRISAPAPDAALIEGQETQFVATVLDLQDVAFAPDRIVWRSSSRASSAAAPQSRPRFSRETTSSRSAPPTAPARARKPR